VAVVVAVFGVAVVVVVMPVMAAPPAAVMPPVIVVPVVAVVVVLRENTDPARQDEHEREKRAEFLHLRMLLQSGIGAMFGS
jgi:hypothetical protein